MKISAKGDLAILMTHPHSEGCRDQHLGRPLSNCPSGDKRGIRRYGACLLPNDDALNLARAEPVQRVPFLIWKRPICPPRKWVNFDTELVREFLPRANSAPYGGILRSTSTMLHGINSHQLSQRRIQSPLPTRSAEDAVETDPR